MTSIITETRAVCAPWCVDHHDGGEHPNDAFCTTERVSIGGIETVVSNGTHDDTARVFLVQTTDAEEVLTSAQVKALADRLQALRDLVDPS